MEFQRLPKNNPKVSVIIASYNQGQSIGDAIDSVLRQTFKDFEIIVVDSSTDKTKEVLSSYKNKIKYVQQEPQGVSAARNLGIKYARGEYIAILDSDDMWLPRRLEKQMAILENFSDIAFVYSNFFSFENGSTTIKGSVNSRRFVSGYILKEILLRKAMCFFVSTWLVRRSCFEALGGFDTSLKMAETREMAIRIAKRYKIYGMKKPLALIRQNTSGASLSRLPAKEKEYYTFNFLNSLFNENDNQIIKKYKKRTISIYHFINGRNYLREGDIAIAKNRFWKSILYNPFQIEVYMYLGGSLLGTKGFYFVKVIKKYIKSLFDKVLCFTNTIVGNRRKIIEVADVLEI